MNEVGAVLEGLADAARVTEDEIAVHRAFRDRVADALAPAGGSAGGAAARAGGAGAGAAAAAAGGSGVKVLRLVDAGSFRHGTAVRGESRFDVFVVLDGGRPRSLARALEGIRSTVAGALPGAEVRLSPDAVLVDERGTDATDAARETPAARLRLIPAHEAPGDGGSAIVAVPDAARRWVLNRPGAREQLIERIDDAHLRTLIRLVLAWKYANRVPVSSYYLETAVIRQALRQPSFSLLWDLCWVLEQAAHDDLMNLPDLSSPSQVQKVRATESLARRIEAQVPLDRAAAHARAAVNAYLDDDAAALDARLTALFGDRFPGLTL